MMLAVIVLMYTVSSALRLPPSVDVINLCSNIKLASPVYFGDGAVCSKPSNQQIDVGPRMCARFEIDTTENKFEGALLFELKRHVKPDEQHSVDILTTEINKDETKCVHMLVAWQVKDSKHSLYVVLVEHDKEFVWNEDKLMKLYYKNRGWLREYVGIISDTWLVDDNTTLRTSFAVRGLKENFELYIYISEEERDYYAMRPLCIDCTR
jgi:hypothetical protein